MPHSPCTSLRAPRVTGVDGCTVRGTADSQRIYHRPRQGWHDLEVVCVMKKRWEPHTGDFDVTTSVKSGFGWSHPSRGQ